MKTIFEDGFERGFFDWQDVPELTIPNDWMLDWDDGEFARPECDQKFQTPEVRSGRSSLAIHTRDGSKHRCVVFRQFEVEPGKLYRVNVWAMGVTGPKGGAGHGMRIGTDPTGNVDFRLPSVAWSEWYSQYMVDVWQDRVWAKLSKVVRAENDTMTGYLWSSSDWKKDAFAHFDDFSIEIEEGDEPSAGDDPVLDRLDTIVDLLREIADKI